MSEINECEFLAFADAGAALVNIRDRRLYRAEYSTFEEYCAKRWGPGVSAALQVYERMMTRGGSR